jgi:MoaA/NifB/PqqE/SkfB family radical SAM enzyme
LQQYQQLLEDLAKMQTMYLMLTGGEPMVHPHFFEIGRIARDLGFVVRVRTNGHLLNQHRAERIRDEVDPYLVEVSLHGATAEVHDRQTRVSGSFDSLIKNITTARQVGLRISVVSTPTAWNEHQIDAMFALCDELVVPLRFQGPVAPRDNGDTAPLVIQPKEATWGIVEARVKAQRQQQEPTEAATPIRQPAEVDREQPATCSVGVAGVDIDPYGNVLACMHLQESAGNLHDQSIEKIWHDSPLFQRARSRAIDAAKRFTDTPPKQLGAPLFCLAVEENLCKGTTGSSCTGSCSSKSS